MASEFVPRSSVTPPEGESPSSDPSAETLDILHARRGRIADTLFFSVDEDPAMMRELDEIDEKIEVLAQKAKAEKTKDAPSVASPETLPRAEQPPEATPLDSATLKKIQAAKKYRAVRESISSTTTPEEKEKLDARKQALQEVFLGQESLEADEVRTDVARFIDSKAMQQSREKQATGEYKSIIPESFFEDGKLQAAVKEVATRIAGGESVDKIVLDAYRLGKNDPTQLRALKVLSTLILQRHSPDGNQEQWQTMPPGVQRLVRFAEILDTVVLMNTVQLRMEKSREKKSKKPLPLDVARYLRKKFVSDAENGDVPRSVKRELRDTTDAVDLYEKEASPESPAEAEKVPDDEDNQSVLATPEKPTASETVINQSNETIIEKKPVNESWQPFVEKKTSDADHNTKIIQRREQLSKLAREKVDDSILDQIKGMAEELGRPSGATTKHLPRDQEKLANYFSKADRRLRFTSLMDTLRAGAPVGVIMEQAQKADVAQVRTRLDDLEILGILWREQARGTAENFMKIESDDAKIQTRLGEMVEHVAIAVRLQRELQHDSAWLQQQEAAQPGFGKEHYNRLVRYRESHDIPDTTIKVLTKTAEQLATAQEQYRKTIPDVAATVTPAERAEAQMLKSESSYKDLPDSKAVTARLQELKEYREIMENKIIESYGNNHDRMVGFLQGYSVRSPELTPFEFNQWIGQALEPYIEQTNVTEERKQQLREYINDGLSRDIERAGELRRRQEYKRPLWKKVGLLVARFSIVGLPVEGIIRGSFAAARLNQQFAARRDLLGGWKAVQSFFRNQERGELLSRRHELARSIFMLGKRLEQPDLIDVGIELERLNLYELKVPSTPATT